VERLQTAAKAKKAQLQRMRTSVPATRARSSTERQAAQLEAASARKIRSAQRKDADRVGAEPDAALKKDQKTARDAKYAARKARQK